ncbi:MAG: hypothetical protein JNM17_25890 [Archangium sp.]|nr:hypothetical protein [Archangium sp.]
MSNVQVLIASPPEYERLVVEIELDMVRLFRVSMEGELPMVELFGRDEVIRDRLLVPASEIQAALARAIEELTKTYP